MESSSTLIIEFQGDDEKAVWLKELVQATYRASVCVNSYAYLSLIKLSKLLVFTSENVQAPPAIDILGETVHKEDESSGTPTSNQGNADLVINGALLETSLSIYGKVCYPYCDKYFS